MTATELRAIERYAQSRLNSSAAQHDLDSCHPDYPSDGEADYAEELQKTVLEDYCALADYAEELRETVRADYRALPLAYQIMLAEIDAVEQAACDAARRAAYEAAGA